LWSLGGDGSFVISGFCIHLPFRNGKALPLARFHARRYGQILIPVAAAIVIHAVFGESAAAVRREVHFVELGAVEPDGGGDLLRIVSAGSLESAAVGLPVISIAFTVAAFTALRHFHQDLWSNFEATQAAVILYPVWLLGCFLAEKIERLTALNSMREI